MNRIVGNSWCAPLWRVLAEAALAGLVLASSAPANNIRVTNVGLARQDTGTANVIFDLAWENSWRDGDNRDAAWVFVKFRAPGSNAWEHAILATNSATHCAGTNGAISAVSDGLGVFIYGATNFAGNVSYPRTKLLWNYGSNGYDFAAGALVEVSVQAIEMVYIPAGAFYLGSGGSESGHFYQYTDGTQTTNCYLVASETNAITVGTNNGDLYYAPSAMVGDGTGIVSNAYPKGYAAFYCMKYEISQGQYVQFLNKLTPAQTNSRYYVTTANRYTIRGSYPGLNASAPNRACNYLGWADGAAYADWAALRPMTELEFEKACRGPAQPAPNEYAWGSTSSTELTNEYGTIGSGMETPLPMNANYCKINTAFAPTRVGIFATAGSTRPASGAGYYGVMELSGNLLELVVTAGTNTGRAFTGLHGNGALTAGGDADVPAWPGTTALGAGFRGGGWADATAGSAQTSSRAYVNYAPGARNSFFGWRGVRTAP